MPSIPEYKIHFPHGIYINGRKNYISTKNEVTVLSLTQLSVLRQDDTNI